MYRYRMTKNQCLIQACIVTMASILLGLTSIGLLFRTDLKGRVTVALCLAAMAAAAGTCWHRWLAYDKK